jgi:mannose-1-phosphate guanylyltransferase
MIQHTLRHLARVGVTNTVINVHHLADRMIAVARNACPANMTLEFSKEPRAALGTGGGIAYAKPLLKDTDPLLVINGDVLAALNIDAAISAHTKSKAVATLLLTDAAHARDFFGVGLDSNLGITGFWGEPQQNEVRRLAFTGVHIISLPLRNSLPNDREACVKLDGWIPAIDRGEPVLGTVSSGTWFDLGTPQRYLYAHRLVSSKLHEWTNWPERQPNVFSADPIPSTLNVTGPATIGPNLKINGTATIGPHCHLGDNVNLSSGVHLSNVVAWSNSTIAASLDSAIVGPFGVVSASS